MGFINWIVVIEFSAYSMIIGFFTGVFFENRHIRRRKKAILERKLKESKCLHCGGNGEVVNDEALLVSEIMIECEHCDGTGFKSETGGNP